MQPWPLRATIVAPESDGTQVLIIDAGDTHKLGCPEDQNLIQTICQAFGERWHSHRQGDCVIRPLRIEMLLRALVQYVPQYKSVQMKFQDVKIEHLLPLPAALEEFKLARWDLLSRTIEQHNLPEAFALKGSPWPCTPPVIEEYPDGMRVIIDGTHRVYSARARGKTSISAIVVSMPNFDFPAIPRGGWDEVSLGPEKRQREDRYDTYRANQFRPIRSAFQQAVEFETATV
jgi:hypothetical protein